MISYTIRDDLSWSPPKSKILRKIVVYVSLSHPNLSVRQHFH